MAEQIKFGTGVNEVGINLGGAKAADRAAKRNDNHFFDYSQTVNGLAQLGTTMLNAKSTTEAADAKSHYIKIVGSEGYREASDTNKAEMLEVAIADLPSRSGAYAKSFEAVSASEYFARVDGRNKETNLATLSVIGSTEDAWMEADSETTYQAQKPDGELVTKYQTNKEAGKLPSDFAKWMKQTNPSIEMSDIRDAQLDSLHRDKMLAVSNAINGTDLARLQSDFVEMDAPYKEGNLYMKSGSTEVAKAVAERQKQLSTMFTAKAKIFKAEAVTDIKMSQDLGNPNILKRHTVRPNPAKYDIGYEGKALQELQKDNHLYNQTEEARNYMMEYDPNIDLDWSQQNDITKKAAQQGLDYQIQTMIENGDLASAGDVIIKNGAVDTKRLNNIKQTLNAGLNSEDGQAAMTQILELKDSNAAAFNALYSEDERADILATDILSRTRNLSVQEVWASVKGAPTGEPTSFKPNQMRKYAKLKASSSTKMKEDLDVMRSALAANNVSADDIYDILDNYQKSEPYKIDFAKDVVDTNTQDVLAERFESYIPTEDSTADYNPNTNAYDIYDATGVKLYSIDKQKFINASTTFKSIAKYNSDHQMATDWNMFLDDTTSKLGHIGFGGSKHGFRPNVYGYTTLEKQAEEKAAKTAADAVEGIPLPTGEIEYERPSQKILKVLTLRDALLKGGN